MIVYGVYSVDTLEKLIQMVHKMNTRSNVNVDFSFCFVLIVGLNYVLNLKKQNKFLSQHKLLPVNLTWLSQVYGKMFSFPIS